MIVARSRFDEKGLRSHFFRYQHFILPLLTLGWCTILVTANQSLFEHLWRWFLFLMYLYLIGMIFIYFWNWKTQWRLSKQSLRENPFYEKEIEWRFDSEGYELSEDDRRNQLKKFTWKEVKCITKSSAGILIYLKEKRYHWIPEDVFASQEEFRALRIKPKGNYAAISLKHHEQLEPFVY